MAERFNFFAPAQQPVDFSIMQRAAEASAAMIAGAGAAIGRGFERRNENKREDALRKEQQKKVEAFTKEVQNEDNSYEKTYRLADIMYPDVIGKSGVYDEVTGQTRYTPTGERNAIVGHLVGAGYNESQANQVATIALTTQTARVMRPGVPQRLKAMGLDLVASGFVSADDLDSVVGEGMYSDETELMKAQYEMGAALGRGQPLTEMAAMEAETQQRMALMLEEHRLRLEASKADSVLTQDIDTFRSTLRVAEATELDKLSIEIEKRQEETRKRIISAEAAKDFVLRNALEEQSFKNAKRLDAIRGARDERMLDKQIKAESDLLKTKLSQAVGPEMNETERKAIDDLVNSMVSTSPPADAIPLSQMYDSNQLAATDQIAADLSPVGASTLFDRQRASEILSKATVKVTRVSGGELGIDVDVPSNRDWEPILESALMTRYRSSGVEAPTVVGVRQLMGGKEFTDTHRSVLMRGMLSPEGSVLLNRQVYEIAGPAAPPPARTTGTPAADDNSMDTGGSARPRLPGAD